MYGITQNIVIFLSMPLYLLPCFVNIVLVLVAFYEYFKKRFPAFTFDELAKNAKMILTLKTINGVLLLSLVLFYSLIIFAFNQSGFLQKFFDAITREPGADPTTSVALGAVFFIFPLIFGYIYYVVVIQKFKSVIMNSVMTYQFDGSKEYEKVIFMFFDSKSEYYLNSRLLYSISTIIVPIAGVIIQLLIRP